MSLGAAGLAFGLAGGLTALACAALGDASGKKDWLSWGATQIVPAAWVEASTRSHVATHWGAGPIAPAGYGYLWFTGQLGDQPVAWAWGYGAQFAPTAPALRLAIVTTASNPRPTKLAAQNDVVMGMIASIVALAK